MVSPKLSVLDLAPIVEGSSAGEALRRSLELARHAESLGYQRFWLAEHHGMPGIASAATAVAIAHVAAGTSKIRLGAGGIMLPNHAPLIVAEQFGTLAALHPGRIDLGVGRAPGTDPVTSMALRREDASDNFPNDVVELIDYFRAPQPGQRVIAVPGAGLDVPVWILGSSLFGAQLAAALGLPYAFASHFAPAQLDRAVEIYRAKFRPSEFLQQPYLMVGAALVAAESDDEARFLATSHEQAFVNLRTGRPGRVPPPRAGLQWPQEVRGMLDEVLSCAVIGSPQTVKRRLDELTRRTQADEIILASQIFDHQKRLRAYELAIESTR